MSNDTNNCWFKDVCRVDDIIEDFYSYVVEKLKNDKERFDKKPLEFHYEIHTEDSDDSHYSIVMKVSFWRKR